MEELLPCAATGLDALGVERVETERLLAIIAARCQKAMTPARWQRRRLAALEARMDRARALAEMLQQYLVLSATNEPVHQWDL